MLTMLKLALPAIIPSWRFFEEIAPSPRIEVTYPELDPDLWAEFYARPQTISIPARIVRLFWNPAWNESLYLVSCAERVVADDDISAARQIAERIGKNVPCSRRFQFRLVFVSRHEFGLSTEIAYVSDIQSGSK